MKKLILLILLFTSSLSASPMMCQMAGGGGAAGCGDLAAIVTGASSYAISEDEADPLFKASSFTATATGYIRSIYIDLKDTGTPTGYVYLYLCPSSGANINSGTAMSACVLSDTQNIGPMGGTFVSKKFSFGATAFSVTLGGKYWIAITHSAGLDATNYYFAAGLATSEGGSVIKSADGTSWSFVDTTAQFKMQVSGCE